MNIFKYFWKKLKYTKYKQGFPSERTNRGEEGRDQVMESPDCQFGRPELLSGILGESEEGKIDVEEKNTYKTPN